MRNSPDPKDFRVNYVTPIDPKGQAVCFGNTQTSSNASALNHPAPPGPFNTSTWPAMFEFAEAIFGEWAAPGKGLVWTTGMAAVDGSSAEWFGAAGLGWLASRFPSMEADLYVCIGVMGGGAKARGNRNVVAQPLLIVDDIGTKIDRAKWDTLFLLGFPPPTAWVETSPGNFTGIWALAGDAADPARWVDLAVIRAWLVEKGLTDDVMDPARYIRLPGGWNSKGKYRAGNGGLPVGVRLAEWNECRGGSYGGARADLDLMGRVLIGAADWAGRVFPDTASGRSQASSAVLGGMAGLVRSADLGQPDEAMALALAAGDALVSIRPGVVEGPCPNIAAHGDRADTGFAYLGDGLMHCNHASCQGLSTRDFRGMLEEQFDRLAALSVSLGGSGVEGCVTARAFLAKAAFPVDDATEVANTIVAIEANVGVRKQAAQTIAGLSASTVQPVPVFVPGQIPPRQWVYSRAYMRCVITVLVAEGGVGKSALAMLEAVATVTGRELLAGDKNAVANRPLTVWYHSSEDSFDEQQRRLAAVLLHYGLKHADLGGRLILTSGHDLPLQFGRMGENGPELTPGTREFVVETAMRLGVDVLILDPLAATHSMSENSNEAINVLVDSFRRIARDANIALCLVHHVAKVAARDMGSAGAGASRGASALTDAARIVRQLRRPTDKEASAWGIAPNDRRSHIIIDNGKANLTRADDAAGLRLVAVRLGNITADYPSGDTVQTVERWTPPTPQPGTASDLKKVQDAIEAHPMRARASSIADDWVGYLVADVRGLDIGAPKTPANKRTPDQARDHAHVCALIRGWIADGGLVERVEEDPADRKKRPFIRVGLPAILVPDASESPTDGEEE